MTKPKRSKFNFGDWLSYEDIKDNKTRLIKVKYIKRYGKRTFMYSQDGSNWVSEYRLNEAMPFSW